MTGALLNAHHPLIVWAAEVEAACTEGRFGLGEAAFETLIERLVEPIGYGLISRTGELSRYIAGWVRCQEAAGCSQARLWIRKISRTRIYSLGRSSRNSGLFRTSESGACEMGLRM